MSAPQDEPVDLEAVEIGDAAPTSISDPAGSTCGRMVIGAGEAGEVTTFGCAREPEHPGRCVAARDGVVAAVSP